MKPEHEVPDYLQATFHELVGIIREGLIRDGHVQLFKFGSFKLNWTKPRKLKDKKTGQTVYSKPQPKVVFTPAKNLREQIQPNPEPVIPIDKEKVKAAPAEGLAEDLFTSIPPVVQVNPVREAANDGVGKLASNDSQVVKQENISELSGSLRQTSTLDEEQDKEDEVLAQFYQAVIADPQEQLTPATARENSEELDTKEAIDEEREDSKQTDNMQHARSNSQHEIVQTQFYQAEVEDAEQISSSKGIEQEDRAQTLNLPDDVKLEHDSMQQGQSSLVQNVLPHEEDVVLEPGEERDELRVFSDVLDEESLERDFLRYEEYSEPKKREDLELGIEIPQEQFVKGAAEEIKVEEVEDFTAVPAEYEDIDQVTLYANEDIDINKESTAEKHDEAYEEELARTMFIPSLDEVVKESERLTSQENTTEEPEPERPVVNRYMIEELDRIENDKQQVIPQYYTDKKSHSKKWLGLLAMVPLIIIALQTEFASNYPGMEKDQQEQQVVQGDASTVSSEFQDDASLAEMGKLQRNEKPPDIGNSPPEQTVLGMTREEAVDSVARQPILDDETESVPLEGPSENDDLAKNTSEDEMPVDKLESETQSQDDRVASADQNDKSVSWFKPANQEKQATSIANHQEELQDYFQKPRIHTSSKGDNLWDLAKKHYGDPYLWPYIYRANLRTMDGPDNLQVGKKIVIPGLQHSPQYFSARDRQVVAEAYVMIYKQYHAQQRQNAHYFLIGAYRYHPEWLMSQKRSLDKKDLKKAVFWGGRLVAKGQ